MKKTPLLILTAALLALSCGEKSSEGKRNYLGTQSPGDVWTWNIGDSDFSAVNLTTGHTYSGTKTTLPSGFLKLSVPDAAHTTDPGISSFPADAYALEYPSTVLLVKPAGTDTKVIVAAGQGSCPTSGGNYNWVQIPWDTWNSITDTAYGTATATLSGGLIDFSVSPYLLDGTPETSFPANGFNCTNGKLTNGGDMTMGITPSGILVGDSGPGQGGIVGMKAAPSAVDMTAAASVTYRGVLFKNNGTGDDTEPVGAVPGTGADAGKLVGFDFTDVDANIYDYPSPNNAILSFDSQPSPGMVKGTLADGAGSHGFTFIVNQVGGKYIIFGISVNTSSAEPYNFFVVQQ